MKNLIVAGLLALATNAWGFGPTSEPLRTLLGHGNLVDIRVTVGDKQAKLFFVGKETARLNFEKEAQLLSVTAFHEDGTTEELRFSADDGFYTIPKLPKSRAPYTLSVSAKVKDVHEKVQLKPAD